MFDRKGCEVGRNKHAIEAQLASFREAIEAASAGPRPEPPAEPLWLRLAAGLGGFVAYLLGLVAVCGLLGLFAAAARFGWESIG